MNKTVFTGAGVAIVTPMNKDFSINYEKLGELIDWQIENGTDSIIICGTTGESSTMSDEEHIDSISFAVERAKGKVPIIAGAGSNDTSYAIWLSKESKRVGADALLQVTPYYNKTSQRGLVAHFNAIADATDLPIILYNVPSRTGVNIALDTYKEIAKHPNIVAVKEASGDLSKIAEIAANCDLDIYSGNDEQILPILSLGGKGVISVLSNVIPKETHEICKLFFENKNAEALALVKKTLKLANMLFCDVNPIPVKAALNLMGKNVGSCRLPLVDLDENKNAMLKQCLAEYNLL